jgi:hypothetical protein
MNVLDMFLQVVFFIALIVASFAAEHDNFVCNPPYMDFKK